jgi:hypothetical protein
MTPQFSTWPAAASWVGLQITEFPYSGSIKPLKRLTELRDIMAAVWFWNDHDEVDEAALFLEAGRVAYQFSSVDMSHIINVVIDKQRSYGPGNILAFGLPGIAVRVSDKIERLKNLTTTGHTPELSEPLADTWLDIVGYSVVGLMLLNGWFELPLGEVAS